VHRGAADAQAGAARGAPRRVEEAADHGPRPVPAQAGRPGQPGLRAARAGPAAVGGLHLRGHPGRHRLYRAGHRRVRPADPRMAHRRQSRHGPGAGRAGNGGHLPGPAGRQGGRAGPPQRRRRGVPVDPVRRRAGGRGDRAVGRVRRGLLRQRAGREHRRAVQDRGHRPPGAMGNPRPGRGGHQRMGQLVQHRAGDAAHRRPPAGRIRAGLAGWHARPGSRPRAGQQAPPATRRNRRRRPWPPLIIQAGSARTRRGSAPDPGPPQRWPGRSGRVRQRAGISSPAAGRVPRNPRPGQGRLRRRRR